MLKNFRIRTLIFSAFAVVGFAGMVMTSPGVHAEGAKVSSGQFEGRSDHVTTGGVSISKDGDIYVVTLEDDFSLDGAPDPKLGFAKGGTYVQASEFSILNSKTGKQVYQLPANINPTAYDEIVVWCGQFSVPLGIASLK